ncbi:MAG: polymer-forming cytoskeletal protein [Anaerolineae bacterium]|nr:polymer-forming cytoskeletal protein [Phycisphaerae bacterium]
MADAGNQEFPTTLGPDAVFKGELSFDKGLKLHGRLEGKINTAGRLHVAKEAKMSADVDAGAIIVEGDVKGNLTASDRIEMKQSARYEGDLRTTKLVVDEGAVFSGNVTVGPEAIKGKGPGGAPVGGASRNEPVRPSAVPQAQPVK